MNYFAHALPFLDNPYFAAGTGVPDWLMVVDRQVRVRRPRASQLADDPDPIAAAVARGTVQHLCDDARFHETRAFAELSLSLTLASREVLGPDTSFRPSFLGHLLVELLLDANLIAEEPSRLDAYYELMGGVEFGRVEAAVNRMATQPTDRLAWMIAQFCEARVLWDYLEDGKLLRRLNQVMRRVALAPLPEHFREILPDARRQVARRRAELLDGIPVNCADIGRE